MRKTIIPILTGLIVIMVLTIGGWLYYNWMIRQIPMDDTLTNQKYKYHYVFITHSDNNSFWQTAYQSAKAAAQKEDTYVEYIKVNDSNGFTLEDYLRISIASKVDGIILESNGTQSVELLINEALECDPEIPVVTVLEDAPQSLRKSFIGVNSYQLGHQYGEAILELLDENTEKIIVLENREGDSVSKNMIFTQIRKTITEQIGEDRKLQIEAKTLKGNTAFAAEEYIRNLLLDPDTTPDILVCLNGVNTASAYQSLIDFNKVGSVNIVGYYPSDTIISAIQKGSIPVVFDLDAKQLGEYSVNALLEYREMGHVSAYFSVDLNIVTQENVDQYLKTVNDESE